MMRAQKFDGCAVVLALALVIGVSPQKALTQDYDDPPARVARLGYMQGSVSFRPAGTDDWVGAVPNRPMTTGDQLWTDVDSRAEVQLGSAVIRLAPMTGFSFLNLDDSTIQIQLTSGMINITVRRLREDDDFEVDTSNQAFTAVQPGHYRIEASNDGTYTVISVRQGAGESTGNGEYFSLRAGQIGTFSGTDRLYADVEPIDDPDDFEMWCQGRDHRYDNSRSAVYLSSDVVGYEDLDDYGDWRDDPNYGHIWFPNQVPYGWAPYHVGHWAWISPWGWTWVDDSPWGYAPFHYGRWVFFTGRWGWVAGPPAVQAVYAPALVVFIGGGPGAFGGNVGWFPLGPREVFVPSYHVSAAYVTRVNVSNTTVNVTQVTNIYNTTIVNNNTTIVNVTYANRSVQGAVMAVPQAAFVSAQPVARAAVTVNAQMIASAPVSARVAVVPTQASVLGAHAATAGRVAAPPAAIANRQVVAKKTPPPPPVPFAKQQQALAAHPGQPLARSEVQKLAPANTAAARPMVRQAPPAKPATPNMGHPANLPGRPAQPAPAARPANASPAQPNRPAEQPNNRPQPATLANRPATVNSPQTTRPAESQPPSYRPEPNNRPEPNRGGQAPQPQTPPAKEHPQEHAAPPAAKPAPAPPKQQEQPKPQPKQKPEKPEEKKPD
jgi:hypothetical protein